MALCDWCGKSLTHYNHDGCWDEWVEADPGPIPQTGDVDPWAELLARMEGRDG